MAVVVQALVPADASAVVFTRHPVTGRDDQLVITAARGLGDAMVVGHDHARHARRRSSRRGTVVEFVPGDGRGRAGARAPPRSSELVALSLAVEGDFGRAVDIEAALAGEGWYLLQARPITTRAERVTRG